MYKIRITFVSILLIIAMCSIASAANYYVDTKTGKDTNSGKLDTPWKTIQKAADTARAGDVVYVKPGVYYESVDLKYSGNSSNPIIFKSYTKHGAVIDGSKSSDIYLFNWAGNGSPNHWVILDGFVIRNGKRYGVWVEGDHNTVQNCIVHNNGTPGSTAHTGLQCTKTNYVRVINNEVYSNGWNGISLGTSTNGTVEYNYSHDNNHHNGINIMPASGKPQTPYQGTNIRYNISCRNGGNGIYMRWQQNNGVSSNILYDNVKSGINITYHPSEGAKTYRSNTKIFNNTIVDNGAYGIRNESGTHLTIKNNIFAYNKKNDINIFSNVTTGHDIDYNLYYDSVSFQWGSRSLSSLSAWRSATGQDINSLESNPEFSERSKRDYSIRSNSPAIDKGLILYSNNESFDIDKNPRPYGKNFDIGAYEFNNGKTSSLLPPLNLRLED